MTAWASSKQQLACQGLVCQLLAVLGYGLAGWVRQAGGQVGGAWFGCYTHHQQQLYQPPLQLKHADTALPRFTHASLTALSNQRTSVNTLGMLLIVWNWNVEMSHGSL